MPWATPPATWPSTMFGLIITPQSSRHHVAQDRRPVPVSGSTSTVHRVARVRPHGRRARGSGGRPRACGSRSAGSVADVLVGGLRHLLHGHRLRRRAHDRHDALLDLEVFGRGFEQVRRRWRQTFSLQEDRAPRGRPAPIIGPLRLPPVPGPNGALSVSPWWTVTSSMCTPRNSAASCAVVVSRPWPCAPEPMNTSTRPSGCMRRWAGSLLVGADRRLRLDVEREPDPE